MAAPAGELFIKMSADVAQLRTDFAHATRMAQDFGNGVSRIMRMAGLSLGSVLSAGAFVALVKRAIDAADEIGKLNQKIGVSVERLSELKFAGELSNVSFDTFTKGLRGFNLSLVEANNQSSKAAKVFTALGVDVRAGPYEAFRQFAEAFSKLPEGELRTAVAMEILKKAGADLIPVLAGGAAGLDAAAEKARALGLVMSREMIRDATAFNDQMTILGSRSKSLGIALANDLLPFLNSVTGALAEGALKGRFWASAMEETLKIGAAAVKGLSELPGMPALSPITEKRFEGFFNPPRQTVTGKIGGVQAWQRAVTPTPAPDPEAVRKALADSEGLMKRQIAAIQQMEERRRSLFGLSEQEIMIERIKTGTYREFDVETKARLLSLARELDLRKQTIDRIEAEYAAIKTLIDRQQQAAALSEEAHRAMKLENDEAQFRIGLIGRTAAAQERLTVVRQSDLATRERMRAQLALLPEDAMGGDILRIVEEQTRLGEEQKRIALASVDARVEAERDWVRAGALAMDNYVEHATNAAEQMRTLFEGAFRSMEDALVDFVMTGKLDFKSLADSIIRDIIRIHIQRNVTAPLAALSGNLFKSIGSFLFGRAGGGAVSPGGAYWVGEHGPEMFVPAGAGSIEPSGRGGDVTVNMSVNMTSLDPRGAAAVIAQNAPVILGIVRREASSRLRASPI